MTPLLKELLEKNSVEDIVLSPRGLSFFENSRWSGPHSDATCNEKNLFVLSRRIANEANITLGLTQPSADAYLLFGDIYFRAHVVVSPMALDGTEITLRRIPPAKQYKLSHFGLSDRECEQLRRSVQKKLSLMVIGATGAGKSSLLSAILSEIPPHERVLILEDSPELRAPTPLSTKLVARSDRFGFREGARWDLSHLVFESLRMRPDRIVVGECRGPEAYAISQAMMTGHRGVMTSLHAGSCTEALSRFDRLVQATQATSNFSSREAWDLVVHVQLSPKNERQVVEIYQKSRAK